MLIFIKVAFESVLKYIDNFSSSLPVQVVCKTSVHHEYGVSKKVQEKFKIKKKVQVHEN